MSHTLTEADEFTATVVVPDGTDSRNDAAGDVERIAQALANRTKNLNTHGVRVDVSNVFTQGQRFDIANAAVPALASIREAVPSNVWTAQLEFKINNSYYVRLYSGNNSGGNWILTSNARWDPTGAQQWQKDDPGQESSMLRGISGEIHAWGKAPGGATWADGAWDSTRGVVKVGDTLFAKFLSATEYRYTAPLPGRWVQVSPREGFITSEDRVILSSGGSVDYVLRPPHGATLGQVNVKVGERAGTDYNIEARHILVKPFSDTSFPPVTETIKDSYHLGSGVAGRYITRTVNFGGLAVDTEFSKYLVRVWTANTSPDLDVWAVQYSFNDPGPRNH